MNNIKCMWWQMIDTISRDRYRLIRTWTGYPTNPNAQPNAIFFIDNYSRYCLFFMDVIWELGSEGTREDITLEGGVHDMKWCRVSTPVEAELRELLSTAIQIG